MTIKSGFQITVISENKVYREKLLAEHGLSLWLKIYDKNYLFDTGQGLAVKYNLEQLEYDINNLDGIILSHGHYDHTGGLKQILKSNSEIPVYGHPDIFTPKYSGTNLKGVDFSKKDITNFIPVKSKTVIDDNLWLAGEVPMETEFEKLNKKYKVKDGEKLKVDSFKDDQPLVIETPAGLVIISGCCHTGLVNNIKYIKEISDNSTIHAVIGGFHLKNADNERMAKTIEYLKKIQFDMIVPMHCTGLGFQNQLLDRFGEKVSLVSVGDSILL
ncbi:MAG: MBL fold metallo-hydrolase [Halothermotrichaceae bacterium]